MPSFPTTLQALHASVQAVLQHRPSTHPPAVLHSLDEEQMAP